ncbi:YbaB/EbfC family DNA-binding protein [Amycolatopsis sp. lyj-90]|uniref:YbaB/EbfC family DNA-binding protein n=1 Tax=Amycolatopsis sp. lyj-90 TaxID=2789285 RepID=UPI00397D12CB
MSSGVPFDPDAGVEEAMTALAREREKLAKLGKLWRDGGLTVRAKDNSLSMKFDGHGEVSELVFNEAKYRSLAPAKLASNIIETLQRGKAESMAKMSDLMGNSTIGGVDLGAAAAGKVDPEEMLEALLSPLMGMVEGMGGEVDQVKNGKSEKREADG